VNPISNPSARANFKLEISSYSGIKFDLFLSQLKAMALSEPKLYFEYRTEIEKYLKEQIVTDIYDTIFEALKNGRKKDGREAISTKLAYSPNFPDDEINRHSVAISRTVNLALGDILEIMCPISFSKTSESRAGLIGAASALNPQAPV